MQNFCMLDMVCALNPCPRPRFFLHHTRHSAKMRIWWPVTSHQVPLFALSGGIWAAKSTATKPPTRPMIERTRTWSQPNHPPAVLDNFGGGPPVPGGRIPKALVVHATMSSASSTSPSPPIPVRKPLTHLAPPGQVRPIIPRTRKLTACSIPQNAPKPPTRPRFRLAFAVLALLPNAQCLTKKRHPLSQVSLAITSSLHDACAQSRPRRSDPPCPSTHLPEAAR